MKFPYLKAVAGAALACAIVAVPNVGAHHSFAMFDMSKKVTLKGSVRTWEWTNPHTWLWLYVTEVDGKPVSDKDGNPVIWGLESSAPGELSRNGITRDTFKKGDKVTVTAAPLKDGRNGGSLGQVTFADGHTVGGGGGGAGGPPPGGGATGPAPGGTSGPAPQSEAPQAQ